MARVRGEFPDNSRHKGKGYFDLTCNKTMYPDHWIPPIEWTGIVNGKNVVFIQVSDDALFLDDFDFTGFPEELDIAKSYIIEEIDRLMSSMD